MCLYNFKDLVSNLAVLMTVFLYMSGVLVCKQYVVNKTTGEASPLRFICGLVSTFLWFLYGLMKQDNSIIVVNTIGVTLMTSYIIVFYIITIKKSIIIKQVLIMVISLLLIVVYIYAEQDYESLINRLGLVACAITLLTIASPLSKLQHVLRVKNTECLPFPMIVMSFTVSTLWLMYGIIEGDPYLELPNFVGASLAVIQLALFVIYPNKSKLGLIGASTIA